MQFLSNEIRDTNEFIYASWEYNLFHLIIEYI